MKKKIVIIAISLVIVTALIICGNIFAVDSVEVVFDNKTDITNEYDILKAAEISKSTIIFNIKENSIKSKVSKEYKDNSIVVTNVERVFPNKVKIFVKERVLIYKLNVFSQTDDDLYVPTDKDFQRGALIDNIDDYNLITVKNFVIKDTFNLEECYELREFADVFISLGISEEALPYFVESIEFSEKTLKIDLRHSSGIFTISRNNIKNELKTIYYQYLKLSDQDKLNCALSI